MASNTSDGASSVMIKGKEVGKKNGSVYTKCDGNQPATRGFGAGVVSHTITGKTKFDAYSMDVRFEGAGAERFLDLTTSNHMSPSEATPSPSVAGAAPPPPPDPECKTLSDKNKEFRKKNDDKVIKTVNDKDVTFGEFGTVAHGNFTSASDGHGPYIGVSATKQLEAAKVGGRSPSRLPMCTTPRNGPTSMITSVRPLYLTR